MKTRRNHPKNKGFSLIELLIVVTIILIIAAIAIPNLVKNKIVANEAAAVETLRTLNGSMLLYANSYGGFPHALSEMGPASSGTAASSAAADLIDSLLAAGVKSGYRFSYVAGSTDPSSRVVSYSITATPVTVGSTGQRSFFTDESGTIRASSNGVADASSAPLG
jgi:prepilin-type N-terminal cleavage/methylation domain-containing protein